MDKKISAGEIKKQGQIFKKNVATSQMEPSDLLKSDSFQHPLLEDYEKERKEDYDESFVTVSNLTKQLWGGFEDQTPYVYLNEDASPMAIIEAIRCYAYEYQNGSTWETMNNMIHKMTFFELNQLDIYTMIDILDGVIHNDTRPDLDY